MLYRQRANSLERSLMLTAAALVCFVPAVLYPFMTFKMEGRAQQSTLLSGVREMFDANLWFLAAAVLCASILFPLLKLVSALYVLLPVWLGRRPWQASRVLRFVEFLQPWAMMEVYLLGVIIAYVKLSELATLELGVALYSFVALIVLMAAADSSLDPRVIWRHLQRGRGLRVVPAWHGGPTLSCHACGLVSRATVPVASGEMRCRGCGAVVHRRKPQSLHRTWALLLTAALLYVPANTYPIMTVISFGQGEPDTIVSGIRELIHTGMWPLALLVFFASVTVPLLKLLGLGYLLVSVHQRSSWRPRVRTHLYRVTEAVGRWSMIDIFMISILVALVKLDSIATIEPGVGATSFAGVVILTMLAAMSFDPRLIWDRMEGEHA